MKRVLAFIFIAAFLIISAPPAHAAISSDEEFLNKLEYDSVLYFTREINHANGLIKDSSRPGSPASVAAVGFGLTSICIGEHRGWITKDDAQYLVLKILKSCRFHGSNLPFSRLNYT